MQTKEEVEKEVEKLLINKPMPRFFPLDKGAKGFGVFYLFIVSFFLFSSDWERAFLNAMIFLLFVVQEQRVLLAKYTTKMYEELYTFVSSQNHLFMERFQNAVADKVAELAKQGYPAPVVDRKPSPSSKGEN